MINIALIILCLTWLYTLYTMYMEDKLEPVSFISMCLFLALVLLAVFWPW